MMIAHRACLRAWPVPAAALSLLLCLSPLSTGPAAAQSVVYDPSNYAQNVLQAARALEQVNNQIRSLTNEAQMLVNQARNLASLPLSTLQQLQASIQKTQTLLSQAQTIAFDVGKVQQGFATTYGQVSTTASAAALLAGARSRWQTSVGAFEDSLKVQAGVVGNLDANGSTLSSLVTASQSATGALQAVQAGNQLLALQSRQLSDLVGLLAAKGRADALEQARGTAAEAQGQEQYRRFATRSGYVPATVQMFGGK